VQLDREVVVRVLSEALARLHGVEHVRVRLNPRDLRMAQQASAPARQPLADVGRLELVADADVAPGGCVVETASGSIDATIETQFAQMEAVLADASGAVRSPGAT
jgi:flagellar biosynthesis/type III secretory pathway protein FliH